MNTSELYAARREFTECPAQPGTSCYGVRSPEPERIIVRCDRASVEAAIARALALGVLGIEARLELTES